MTGVRHALDGYLDDDAIAARRRALEDEELGLAGLVPVDRILATVGGLIGGATVVVAAIAVEVHVRRLRRINARD